MPLIFEPVIEQAAIGWFRDLGYDYAFSPDLPPCIF
jgi:hypothetical protein